MLHSTLGRHAARAIRCAMMSELTLKHWELLVDNIGKGDSTSSPTPCRDPDGEYRGVGFHEAPRGTLSHWVVIKNKKINNYQAVVPSTWNASPRDEKGRMGAYEASLIGNPVAEPTSRWRCCAPSTPSIPASPARCTPTTQTGPTMAR